jgi:dCTP deaminase
MSVLTGPAIQQAYVDRVIEIDPFSEQQINPTSYDLRLGKQLRMYCSAGEERAVINWALRGIQVPLSLDPLDAAKVNHSVAFDIPAEGIMLHPANFYLGHTLERVSTARYQPSLEGKSSIARLGIEVHLTAGWGEPGFDGEYTLEIACKLPVRIYAGMRICQIKFETLEGDIIDYKRRGHYVGKDARGAVASRSYTQFLANPEK